MRTLTTKIITEIAYHEGIVREAYLDSVGVWTWSAGITSASGHSVERYKRNPQRLSKCLEVYVWLLREKYLPAVLRAFEGHDLTEAQLAAALSFHWNTGAIERASWVKQFMAGDGKARSSFMNWKRPAEIVPRRKAERDLFFDGAWSGDGTVLEWTRVSDAGRIDWSSGVRKDVSAHMAAILEPASIPQAATEAATDNERTSLAQSTTMQASVAQIGAAVVTGGTAVSALDGTAQIIAVTACVVIALAALWIMRERVKKWAGGVR